jgi:hypothetical protein
MLKPRSPLYNKIIPADHLLRKINQVVDFSFMNELVKDKYTPDLGRPKTPSSCSGCACSNTQIHTLLTIVPNVKRIPC